MSRAAPAPTLRPCERLAAARLAQPALRLVGLWLRPTGRRRIDLALTSTVTLHGGVEMPHLGLGMWRAGGGDQAAAVVRHAVEVGYRLFDTAAMYGNEDGVGRGVATCEVPREELFVTTKVWNTDQGYDSTLRAFETSRRRLGLEQVDLYLVHWPVPDRRLDTWRAMERLLDEGACRAIGVSNYLVEHLQEVLAFASTPPAVNQIELHPYNYGSRRDVVEFCREHDIAVEAYSPLTRGRRFDDPPLVEIAARHDRTPAQVLIRWGLQHGFVEIPKSSDAGRMRENADVFDFALTDEEMARLDARNETLAVSWDPTGIP